MHKENITGLILAGGRARRMGGIDKGLVELQGRPMVSHVIDRITPQVHSLIINANRNLDAYRRWAEVVIEDRTGDFDGPLAGLATGLRLSTTECVLTVPCDSPQVSLDYAERMYAQLRSHEAEIAVATDGQRTQPVFMLVSRHVLPDLETYLREGGRKIDHWYEQHHFTAVDFSDQPQTFLNINTPEEIDGFIARQSR